MQTKLYVSTLLIYGMVFSTLANANDTFIIDGNNQKTPVSSSYEVVPLRVISLSDIKVSKTREGNDRVELQFSSSSSNIQMKTLGDKVLLELGDIEISSAIWSKHLPSAIKLIPKIVDQSGKKHGTKIEINLGRSAKAEGINIGNKFVLDLIPIRTTASNTGSMTEKKRYTGKSVSFNFQDVPIRTVLQLLSEESGHNIVVSDNVSGNVTLRLLDIPWDQALDIVSQAKGLDYRKNNNVIWVGLQDDLARSEQAKEDARIALENKVELETMYIPVNYHSAVSIYKTLSEDIDKNNSEGKERENSFFSSRGRVVADERTNTLILTDIPSKLKQLKELIDAIDRPVDQVLIEARLVVATDGYARELGSRFGVMGTRSGTNNATIGSSIEGNSGNTGFRTPNVNLSAGGFTTSTPGAIAYTLLGSNFSLDMELSAMQEQNKGEVISNPRLITSNQREGVIRQGKEIGYVTVTGGEGGSAATPNVQFKEALLELKVTPTITNDNRVFLNLNVKKDEIDQFIDLGNYGAVPQISKREISTAVLIEDGQTLVVGGIYEFTDRQSLAQIPLFGDIPFLGNLFKKRGNSKQKAELLVFITPRTMIMGERLDPNSVLKQ